MAWRVPVAISEKKHQCHVLSIFKALCYGNRCMFLCCVCLSISLVILNCWMISIKRGREAKVLELISFLQVSLKVTVWIERGNPTYSFRNSICSMHLTSLTRQEFTMGEIVFCFPVVGKMATGRHWICSHHLQQLQDYVYAEGTWILGRMSTVTLLCASGKKCRVSFMSRFGHFWSRLLYLSYLCSVECELRMTTQPGWWGSSWGVVKGTWDNFLSFVAVLWGVRLCASMMSGHVMYSCAHVHLYSLLHLIPAAPFLAKTVKSVGFTTEIPRFNFPPLLTLFSGPREWVFCPVSPPDCAYVQIKLWDDFKNGKS